MHFAIKTQNFSLIVREAVTVALGVGFEVGVGVGVGVGAKNWAGQSVLNTFRLQRVQVCEYEYVYEYIYEYIFKLQISNLAN